MTRGDVETLFTRWIAARAVLHRGYWLVTSLYLVVEAELSAFELVFIGVAQGVTGLVFEVPTGVVADALSRKRSLVISHALMGTAMALTGLVTAFPALVATQMLWGLAWTFASGADVAWLTDELERPERAPAVLARGARFEQLGTAAGLLGFGALAWAVGLGAAIVASGLAMLALGAFVAVRFGERGFVRPRERTWRASAAIFRRGVALARGERAILLVFAATVLVNGAGEAFGRLYAKRLVELGFPDAPHPIVWLTALGLAALALGAIALRVVEARIDGARAAPRLYAGAAFTGAFGLALLALAPDARVGMAGVLLVEGIAWTVTRCVSVIWVNRHATSEVRATLQSFLGQAEYLGEIALGLVLGLVAQASGIPAALAGSCALAACAGLVVARSRAVRDPTGG